MSGAGVEVGTLQSQMAEYAGFAELAEAMHAGIGAITVRIAGTGDGRRVVVFFRQPDFPDELFGYRCMPPGADRHELVWLGEELATGALHRLMRSGTGTPDTDGVVWLRLRGSTLVATLVV